MIALVMIALFSGHRLRSGCDKRPNRYSSSHVLLYQTQSTYSSTLSITNNSVKVGASTVNVKACSDRFTCQGLDTVT